MIIYYEGDRPQAVVYAAPSDWNRVRERVAQMGYRMSPDLMQGEVRDFVREVGRQCRPSPRFPQVWYYHELTPLPPPPINYDI